MLVRIHYPKNKMTQVHQPRYWRTTGRRILCPISRILVYVSSSSLLKDEINYKQMLVHFNAQERTRGHLEQLLRDAGWRMDYVYKAQGDVGGEYMPKIIATPM